MIFAYVGDALHPEPIELPFPEQLASPEFSSFLCYCEWEGDYRYVYDNVMDPMHGTFLHKQSHSMAFGDTTANFKRARDADRLRVREGRPAQRELRLDRVPRHRRALAAARDPLSDDRRARAATSTSSASTRRSTETRAAVFHWRCRKVEGWQRDAWRFLYKNRLEARHWRVLEQDRVMLEQFEPDANQRENLYQHDMGVARLRRVFRTKAEAQLKALEAAGLPVQ